MLGKNIQTSSVSSQWLARRVMSVVIFSDDPSRGLRGRAGPDRAQRCCSLAACSTRGAQPQPPSHPLARFDSARQAARVHS